MRYGADVLHRPAEAVTEVTPEVRQLVDDMIQTMYAAPGIGLAATQVGVGLRIFVADISVGRNPADLLAFLNPEFVERDGMQLEEEGCLSVPGFNATVARPSHVVLKGLDREGLPQQVEATGLLARCFQHEMDHLEGTVFDDRLRGLQKDLIVRRIRKLSRSGKW
jgi:peptide deformylase